MAKKNTNRVCIAVLKGGPRDADKCRVVYPPPPYFRLAFPEWSTYVLEEKTSEADAHRLATFLFRYTGPEPPSEDLVNQVKGF